MASWMRSKGKWENMEDKPISFIIVNYNYKKDIQQLISSLAASMPQNSYEVIIVDNASTDDSRTYFSGLGGNIVYLYLDTNIGYGAANNRGVELSSGPVIVLINPDTLVQQKGFDKFILTGSQEDIGVLAPKVVYPDGEIQPNCAGYSTLKTFILQSLKVGYFVRKYNLTNKLKSVVDRFSFLEKSFIGTYLANFSEQSGRKVCDWVSGACMIMEKRIFDEVNGFDENFFLYCEDEDLCRRISERGHEIVVDPSFTILHNEGYIKSRESRMLTFAAKHRYESSIYYLEKYRGVVSATFLRLFYLFQHLFNGIFYMFTDMNAAKSYFMFLPELLKKTEKKHR